MEASSDGRHLRSLRSRDAVVDAMLDLMRETGEQPSAQAVAERAEVSLRTVFRHFEDVDSLFAAAVAHQVQRVGSLFDPLPATGDLPARIEELVSHRARLFEEIAPIRRVAQRRDHNETVREWLARSQDLLRGQTTTQFAPELHPMPADRRRIVVEALDLATGWPAWDAMRRLQGLEPDAARAVVAHVVTRLLV